jgi:hypothetical protein
MKIVERNSGMMNRPGRVGFDRSGPLFALLNFSKLTYLLLRKQSWQRSAGTAFCLFRDMASIEGFCGNALFKKSILAATYLSVEAFLRRPWMIGGGACLHVHEGASYLLVGKTLP